MVQGRRWCFSKERSTREAQRQEKSWQSGIGSRERSGPEEEEMNEEEGRCRGEMTKNQRRTACLQYLHSAVKFMPCCSSVLTRSSQLDTQFCWGDLPNVWHLFGRALSSFSLPWPQTPSSLVQAPTPPTKETTNNVRP